MKGQILCIIFLYCVFLTIATGDDTRLEIIEDEVMKDDDWIMVLHCNLHNRPGSKDDCTDIIWVHESEENVIQPVTNYTDDYHISNDLENYTSTLELLSSDSTEELYTCIFHCESRTYKIHCWIGEAQNKERSSVCSERRFNDVISATAITPSDEAESKKKEDLKIGLSVLCMLIVGMVLTVIIRCRLKRQDALKHARAVLENANQCLLETRNRPSCDYPRNISQSAAPLLNDTPIYRPPSQRNDRAFRTHRSLQRLYPEGSRTYRNRLVLQQMADGSQLIFVPGSKLPSYEDSQSSNRRLSMETFQQTQDIPNAEGTNPFGFLSSVNRASISNTNTGQLSSPPSYSSMAPENAEEEHYPSETLPKSVDSVDGLHFNSDQQNSDTRAHLVSLQGPYVSCTSLTSPNSSVSNSRNTPPPPYTDSNGHSK